MCVCVCSSEFDDRLLFPYYFSHFDVRVKLALQIDPVVDMSGGDSKVRYCKEQYCIGTWNARSMN